MSELPVILSAKFPAITFSILYKASISLVETVATPDVKFTVTEVDAY